MLQGMLLTRKPLRLIVRQLCKRSNLNDKFSFKNLGAKPVNER